MQPFGHGTKAHCGRRSQGLWARALVDLTSSCCCVWFVRGERRQVEQSSYSNIRRATAAARSKKAAKPSSPDIRRISPPSKEFQVLDIDTASYASQIISLPPVHIAVMNIFRPLTKLVGRPSSILPSPFTRAISFSTPLTASPLARRDTPSINFGDWLDRQSNRSGPPDVNGPMELSKPQPHRMHVYATKHNTHITFTQPPRKDPANPGKQIDVLMSLSAGNIGFKKAGRGSYDAGYQLAAFVLKQIQERGLMRDLHSLEVVLRGFGKGREAVTKALLGSEGYLVRNKISSVKDATRLKFGGSRSPKPRRLG